MSGRLGHLFGKFRKRLLSEATIPYPATLCADGARIGKEFFYYKQSPRNDPASRADAGPVEASTLDASAPDAADGEVQAIAIPCTWTPQGKPQPGPRPSRRCQSFAWWWPIRIALSGPNFSACATSGTRNDNAGSASHGIHLLVNIALRGSTGELLLSHSSEFRNEPRHAGHNRSRL
jgi:hypothetical protein